MKKVEPELAPELHEEVTKLLCELTAYNIMHTIHGILDAAVEEQDFNVRCGRVDFDALKRVGLGVGARVRGDAADGNPGPVNLERLELGLGAFAKDAHGIHFLIDANGGRALAHVTRHVVVAADGEDVDAMVLEPPEFARDKGEFERVGVGIVKQVAAVKVKLCPLLDGKINALAECLPNAAATLTQLVARHFGVIAVEMVVGGKDDPNHNRNVC